jgi:hypothetical protein
LVTAFAEQPAYAFLINEREGLDDLVGVSPYHGIIRMLYLPLKRELIRGSTWPLIDGLIVGNVFSSLLFRVFL